MLLLQQDHCNDNNNSYNYDHDDRHCYRCVLASHLFLAQAMLRRVPPLGALVHALELFALLHPLAAGFHALLLVLGEELSLRTGGFLEADLVSGGDHPRSLANRVGLLHALLIELRAERTVVRACTLAVNKLLVFPARAEACGSGPRQHVPVRTLFNTFLYFRVPIRSITACYAFSAIIPRTVVWALVHTHLLESSISRLVYV